MKMYQGTRAGLAADLTVDGHPLNPRLDLWNHSPSGFEWGYGGSGPAQLALALLADHTGDDAKAVTLHQDFKRSLVSDLPYAGWTLTTRQIQWVVEMLQSSSSASLTTNNL